MRPRQNVSSKALHQCSSINFLFLNIFYSLDSQVLVWKSADLNFMKTSHASKMKVPKQLLIINKELKHKLNIDSSYSRIHFTIIIRKIVRSIDNFSELSCGIVFCVSFHVHKSNEQIIMSKYKTIH